MPGENRSFQRKEVIMTKRSETKKAWKAPQLTIYGSVAEITGNGTVPNADVPYGNSNTAYPPHS